MNKCTIENCDRNVWAKNLCSRHYQKKRMYGDPLASLPKKYKDGQTCEIPECERLATAKNKCFMHYQIERRGTTPRKYPNKTLRLVFPVEYAAWCSMRNRIYNPNHIKHNFYGGRGITICERWNKFENFIEDMGAKPHKSYSLDRIDNNGNYEPSNCRWATPVEQANNRSNNRRKNK